MASITPAPACPCVSYRNWGLVLAPRQGWLRLRAHGGRGFCVLRCLTANQPLPFADSLPLELVVSAFWLQLLYQDVSPSIARGQSMGKGWAADPSAPWEVLKGRHEGGLSDSGSWLALSCQGDPALIAAGSSPLVRPRGRRGSSHPTSCLPATCLPTFM